MARVKQIDIYKQELELILSNPSLIKSQKGWTQEEYDSYIAELEKKIEMSKRGRSSRNKGSNYERTVAKIFKEKLGIDLVRTPMSGGFQKKSEALSVKGDITNLDHNIKFLPHIECKDHASWSLPSWIRQSEEDCPKGHIPMIVMHQRQKNKDGKRIQEAGEFITLKLEDFLDIVDKDKIIIPKIAPKKILRKKVK